jgi:hypothetical protein
MKDDDAGQFANCAAGGPPEHGLAAAVAAEGMAGERASWDH